MTRLDLFWAGRNVLSITTWTSDDLFALPQSDLRITWFSASDDSVHHLAAQLDLHRPRLQRAPGLSTSKTRSFFRSSKARTVSSFVHCHSTRLFWAWEDSTMFQLFFEHRAQVSV